MAESILKKKNASSEAVSTALLVVHIAWNYADEEDYKDELGYIHGLQEINQMIAPIKKEFIIDDAEGLVDRLMKYKEKYYKNDKRVIFSCAYENGKVRCIGR